MQLHRMLIISIVMLISVESAAVVEVPPVISVPAEVTASSKTSAPSVEQVTVSLLKEQLLSERQSSEKILATVYWALGVIGTLTFALIGFGWFANFRLYERDKDILKRTLEADLSKAISEGVASIDQRSAAALALLTERLEKVQRSIPDLVAERVERGTASLAGSISSTKDDIAKLEIELNDHQARYCYERGALSPALHFANKAIRLSISAKKPWNVQHQLNTMEEHLARGGAVLPTVLNDVIGTVESIGEEVTDSQKERVLEKLRRFGPPEPSPNNSYMDSSHK